MLSASIGKWGLIVIAACGVIAMMANDALAQRRRGNPFGNFGEAKPKVGETVDDFTATLDNDDAAEFKLSEATDAQPVLLVVGSCT